MVVLQVIRVIMQHDVLLVWWSKHNHGEYSPATNFPWEPPSYNVCEALFVWFYLQVVHLNGFSQIVGVCHWLAG